MGGPWRGRGPGAGAEAGARYGGRSCRCRRRPTRAPGRPRPAGRRGRAAPATTVRRRVGLVAAGVERAVELSAPTAGSSNRPGGAGGEGQAGRLADASRSVTLSRRHHAAWAMAARQVTRSPRIPSTPRVAQAVVGSCASGAPPPPPGPGQRRCRPPSSRPAVAARLGAGRRGAVVAEPGPHLGPPGRVVAGQDGTRPKRSSSWGRSSPSSGSWCRPAGTVRRGAARSLPLDAGAAGGGGVQSTSTTWSGGRLISST